MGMVNFLPRKGRLFFSTGLREWPDRRDSRPTQGITPSRKYYRCVRKKVSISANSGALKRAIHHRVAVGCIFPDTLRSLAGLYVRLALPIIFLFMIVMGREPRRHYSRTSIRLFPPGIRSFISGLFLRYAIALATLLLAIAGNAPSSYPRYL